MRQNIVSDCEKQWKEDEIKFFKICRAGAEKLKWHIAVINYLCKLNTYTITFRYHILLYKYIVN